MTLQKCAGTCEEHSAGRDKYHREWKWNTIFKNPNSQENHSRHPHIHLIVPPPPPLHTKLMWVVEISWHSGIV